MRGTKVQGRFRVEYEHGSINEGVVDELRDPVGTDVDWWVWDSSKVDEETWFDDTYDVSSSILGNGRTWNEPINLPVIMAQALRGTNVMNERGFYIVDTLRLVVAEQDLLRLLPDVLQNPASHIKDRIVKFGEVFVPTRVLPRGRYADQYAVVTIDLNRVNPEEMVNDPQFQDYAG